MGLRKDLVELSERSFELGYDKGRESEREYIHKALKSYFELTEFSVESEGAERNDEWNRGYQAAMAIAGIEQ